MKKLFTALWYLIFIMLAASEFTGMTGIPAEKWCIATGGDNSSTAAYCASELQELLSYRIGKKLPIVKDRKLLSGPVILLDKNDPALGPQSFRIVRENDVIRIIGGSPIGTLYGVYEFLQRFCDVWNVAPGVVYAPKDRPLSFREMDLTMHPAIQKRVVYHAGGMYTNKETQKKWRDFDIRNRVNSLPVSFRSYTDPRYNVSYTAAKECHTFYAYVPPQKYGKEHPEYFSMDSTGVRNMSKNAGGQLCLSNPDVEKIVTEVLLKAISKDRKKHGSRSPRVYDFSQMDNANYLCCCPECRKIIGQYGNADSGLLIWFVNKVARTIKKKYPDVLIRTFAYVNTEKLPTGIKPDDNVLIQLCDLYSKSNHTLPLMHPFNRERKELVEGWSKIAKNIMIWDYILQNGNEPVVPVDALATDVRFFRSRNVKWIFMESETSVGNPSSFEYLKDFAAAQLYFNPDQDLEKLLDVYCRGCFGTVHKEMLAYLNYLREAQNEDPTPDMGAWHLRELKHITLDFLKRCREMIQKAMDANKDPQVALRILQERNVIDNALVRMLAAYPKFADKRQKLLPGLLENRLKVLRACGLTPDRLKKVEREIRLPIEENMLVFTDIPEELKKLPSGAIRFLGASRQQSCGHGSFVQDPDSQLRRVVMWTHPNRKKFTKEIYCGIYDQQWKKAKSVCITATSDEKYHWYKTVRFSMGPSTIFWALDWHAGFNLKGFYIVSDGVKAEDDPNLYDLWVSVKFQGPAYNKDSKKENGIFFERAMLIPVSRKYGNLNNTPSTQGEKKMNLKKSKIAAGIMSAAACMVMSAAGDLPKELEGLPKEEIIDISANIYGPKEADPESPTGKTGIYIPAKGNKKYDGINMGVFDKKYHKTAKDVIAFSRHKPKDESYHWYKIARRKADPEFQGGAYNTQIYLENWKTGAWVPADLKGKYDCWVQIKAQGPYYVDGSTKENKLFLRRVLLVPLKK